ncbi:MAG: DUF262 domain-containing protein [Bacteroidetes bacterium]|nr:MAG: DUF262 domain-containing protein [Bacteroidota bacterium]
MSQQTAKPYSLWQLLKEYAIQIPRIQRDYAQGRSDPKTQEVRKGFVEELIDKLVEGEKLNLDFVYGTVKDNTLTLLDGQQRVTTLFLLHWYVAMRAGKLNEAKSQLSKFSYDTRFSSRDFCEKLVDCVCKDSVEKGLNPSACLEDQPWFFTAWKKDPTVAGMLVMLDAIHEAFEKRGDWDKDWKGLWGKLQLDAEREATASTGSASAGEPVPELVEGSEKDASETYQAHSASACPITFQFLNMDKFGLTDELYIKMNARGKQLTDFEHFKAWLQEEHRGFFEEERKEARKEDRKDFYTKLDNDWTDIFWSYRDKGNKIDEAYLRFFQGVALHKWLLSKPGKEASKDDREKLIKSVNENRPLLKSDWEKLFGEKETLNYTFGLLDRFTEGKVKELAEVLNSE